MTIALIIILGFSVLVSLLSFIYWEKNNFLNTVIKLYFFIMLLWGTLVITKILMGINDFLNSTEAFSYIGISFIVNIIFGLAWGTKGHVLNTVAKLLFLTSGLSLGSLLYIKFLL